MSLKPTKKKINIKSITTFIICLFIIPYFIVTLINQKMMINERREVIKKYENRISDAKLEQQTLNEELNNVHSDEYLEKLAREKLGLVKPNDRVFVDVTKN